ncbi:MAG: family 10 glycosylhydrolase [Kiritimatiellae bacterium]|nr:family 10 glycosylhydrolase [Kiritimatiellia bacterium]
MRTFLIILFCCFAFTVRAVAIAVVHAEDSVPETERRYAKSLAAHIHRWYSEAGVESVLLPDRALQKNSAYRLVFLVDCQRPTKALISTVKALLARGTRFVVCYSASPELATLFGLKCGENVRSDTGKWSAMAFGPGKPKGAPSSILQTSTTLFTVRPATSETQVIGWWQNRAGERTDAAWLRTKCGSYWMTHILTGDGDEAGKQRLLLSIAAEANPEVWNLAAKKVFGEALLPLKDGSLMKRTWSLPKSSPRRKQLERTFKMVHLLQVETQRLVEERAGYKAYQSACELRDYLARTYGMTYFSRPGEVVGVWDHSGRGLFPGDWKRTAHLLAVRGVTDVYVNVAGAGFALYPSKVLPQRTSESVLQEAVAACRQYGLRVHAWILCYSCTNAAPGAVDAFKAKGWTLQDVNGKELNWLDPTHPEVKQYLVKAVLELAASGVDGVHLDFIRFPDLPSSLGRRTRARFEAVYGKASNWPACITESNGAKRAAFLRWRETQIADTVLAIRSKLRAQTPGVSLSAAVFGKYPSCVDSVGQDWLSWLRTGLLDYALPMNYTENPEALRDWLGTQTADARLASKIISGIGVTAAESRLEPIDVLRQIEIIRKMNCKGFALFDLDEKLRREVFPTLAEGVTKQ